MRNLIILGSGRSGTSLVAGLFVKAGAYCGEKPIGPQPANPRGYFESFEINRLNEDLLAGVPRQEVPRKRWVWPWTRREQPPLKQLWLARVPLDTRIEASPECARRIQESVHRSPFCFKDPRFCYTLPAWRPHLRDTGFICVFRAPQITALSILRNCRTSPFYWNIAMTRRWALSVWECMYTHVRERHRHQGDWQFIHYEQALSGAGIRKMEEFAGTRLDAGFADPRLSRTRAGAGVPRRLRDLYRQLCQWAGYEGGV